MDLRELQLKELDILKDCLEIMKKNNLRYYMLGGTFLGAVRHKGFIPWDDDIDIGMPRDDYDKFCEIAKRELNKPLILSCFLEDENYNEYISRVVNEDILLFRDDSKVHRIVNLWIDIFPLDGLPNNSVLRNLHKINLLFLRLLLQYSNFEKGVNMKKERNVIEAILIKIGPLVSKVCRFDVKKRLLAIDKSLRHYKYEQSKYVVNFMGAYKFKEMFPRKIYEDCTEYQFEDLFLPAPRDYDKVLSQMYGDYMKLPEENQRFSHSIQLEKAKRM